MESWLDEWRSKILPLRERFGFKVLGAWTIAEEDRFIWILGYDSTRRTFAKADEMYYNSRERKSITPNPARHLAKTNSLMMEPVIQE